MPIPRALYLLIALVAFSVSTSPAQQIAFTWDDLPAHSSLPQGETRVEIGHKIIDAMKTAHMPPVYGFVNGVQLEREPTSAPMLKDWRHAGFPLGNHTWSHMSLNANSLADWEADLLKNEPVLQQNASGSDWHWLRYPFLAEGNTPEKRAESRKFLADHNYKIAAVTMSFGDYMWNEPYARCVAKNDPAAIAQLESSYLDAAAADIDFRRAMAKALYGHDIPYVLLMHVGSFDARMLPGLLKLYRDKGFTFITLEEAEKDPFYASDIDPSLPDRPDTLEGAMQARGLPLPPRPTAAIDPNSLCRSAQASDIESETKDGLKSMHAEGTFEVKTSPLTADEATTGTAIGRYGLDKQFHGDLEATSKGEMLGAGSPATGTAGYVAIEQVTGKLNGRTGSFALQHFGTMEDNNFDLNVKVVPGSGSGELAGISGAMQIIVASGRHTWKFDYTLSAPK